MIGATHGVRIAIVSFLLAGTFASAQESGSVTIASQKLAPQQTRMVSPKVAAMLAAAMPKYNPPKAVVAKPVEIDASANAVVMTRVVVTDSTMENKIHALVGKIREEKEKAAVEKFNWKDGGTILGTSRMNLMLKFVPKHKGFDILEIKW
jgi:hypothetical protein